MFQLEYKSQQIVAISDTHSFYRELCISPCGYTHSLWQLKYLLFGRIHQQSRKQEIRRESICINIYKNN